MKDRFTRGKWGAHRRWHLIVVIVAALLPGAIGLIWWQGQSPQARQNEIAQEELRLLARLEKILDRTHEDAVAMMSMVGQPCSDVVEKLRLQAALIPQARSLLLAQDGVLYCSTLYGEITDLVSSLGPSIRPLMLMTGSTAARERPMLLYRYAQGEREAIVVMDALHVRQLLDEHDPTHDFSWLIGDVSMGRDGVLKARPSADMSGKVSRASSRYPITMTTDMPAEGAFTEFHAALLLAFSMLLGVATGYAAHRGMVRRWGLNRELWRAVRNEEFVPHYQPLVRCADMQWSGIEVLARWEHPQRGILIPKDFLSHVEKSEFIFPMTAQLMSRAAHELAQMLPVLPEKCHVAFNIAPMQLSADWLLGQCHRFLAAFPPGRIVLVLELTEREGVVADTATHRVLEDLRRMGVCIALDDFGVGHSNLGQLQDLRTDQIKIDRGFVAAMPSADGELTPILRTILDLAERLDLDVVAEGVETQYQAETLARNGVSVLQGYLFARPLAGEALPAVLADAPTHGPLQVPVPAV